MYKGIISALEASNKDKSTSVTVITGSFLKYDTTRQVLAGMLVQVLEISSVLETI